MAGDSEDYDEGWERNAEWFLSGLSDRMPSRDDYFPQVYPPRHGIQDIPANNYWLNDETAMPVHPTCLEVYKRASVWRSGKYDIQNLASWWRSATTYDEFYRKFPRADAVKRGRDQTWFHTVGDEFLAADPCFVPKLASIFETVRKPTAKSDWASLQTKEMEDPPQPATDAAQPALGDKARGGSAGIDSFARLPGEIVLQILSCLSVVAIAQLSLAVPSVYSEAQSYSRSCLLQEKPYLWELWSAMPYSRWTGTTAAELAATKEAFDDKEREIARGLRALREEGLVEEALAQERLRVNHRVGRFQELCGPVWFEKPALTLDSKGSDFARLAVELDKAIVIDKIKGIRNRERIWKDCMYILDKIQVSHESEDIAAC